MTDTRILFGKILIIMCRTSLRTVRIYNFDPAIFRFWTKIHIFAWIQIGILNWSYNPRLSSSDLKTCAIKLNISVHFHYEIPLIFESISTKTGRVEFAYIKNFNNVWVLYLVFRLTCYHDVYRFNRVSRNGLLEKITAEMKFHWNYGF